MLTYLIKNSSLPRLLLMSDCADMHLLCSIGCLVIAHALPNHTSVSSCVAPVRCACNGRGTGTSTIFTASFNETTLSGDGTQVLFCASINKKCSEDRGTDHRFVLPRGRDEAIQ